MVGADRWGVHPLRRAHTRLFAQSLSQRFNAGLFPLETVIRQLAPVAGEPQTARYFFVIFGGKSQRSLPFREERSTSTSATPALDNLSDAPVSAEIVLVKSGS